MKIIQLKTKLSRMPIIAIFFILVMFVASCTTDEGDEAIFSFVGCPEEAVSIEVTPVDITATPLTFPSTVQASWDTPEVINLGDAELVGPIVTDANGETIPDLESGSDFSITSTPGAITVYTVTYSVPSSPADNCEFEIRFLTGEDTEAPTFAAVACPNGEFNTLFTTFTTFTTASPEASAVIFSDLMVTLLAPPGTPGDPSTVTVPLLTALAGNVMDNFDGAVPPSAITVGLSNADMTVTAEPTTADVFGANLELSVGEYTVTINAVDTAGNDTATDADGNPTVLCTLTMSIVPNLTGVGFANCPTDLDPFMGVNVESQIVVPTAETGSGYTISAAVVRDAMGLPTMPPDLTFFNENTEDSTYTIIYTALDGSDIIGTCPFTVTVDNTAPTFADCLNMQDPVNAGMLLPTELSTQRGSTVAGSFTAPTAMDDDNPLTSTLSIVLTSEPDSELDTDVSYFDNAISSGDYTLTYTATDDVGNTATCVFTVTVDNTAPTFTGCPMDAGDRDIGDFMSDMVASAFVGQGAHAAPTAMDAISLTPSLSIVAASDSDDVLGTNVSYFDEINSPAEEEHTLTYTATDGVGNTATCVFTVTVDDTAPMINCPTGPATEVFTAILPGFGGAVITWEPGVVSATDLLDNNPEVTFAIEKQTMPDNPSTLDMDESMYMSSFVVEMGGVTAISTLSASVDTAGIYRFTAIATDAAGNIARCTPLIVTVT